jgi:beta-mannanase
MQGEADKIAARGGYDILMCWELHEVNFDEILSGRHDEYIRDYVRAASSYPGEVVLRPFHESNSNWYDWAPGSGRGFCSGPEQWKQAWRKVVQVARSTHKGNVKFLWCMNGRDIGGPPMESLFPGEDWVDYVGVDAFDWGGGDTLIDILTNAYNRITVLDTVHDFWIGETGMDTQSNGAANFYLSVYTTPNFPRLKTVCWFNAGPFRITTNPAALAVHKSQLVRMPQY